MHEDHSDRDRHDQHSRLWSAAGSRTRPPSRWCNPSAASLLRFTFSIASSTVLPRSRPRTLYLMATITRSRPRDKSRRRRLPWCTSHSCASETRSPEGDEKADAARSPRACRDSGLSSAGRDRKRARLAGPGVTAFPPTAVSMASCTSATLMLVASGLCAIHGEVEIGLPDDAEEAEVLDAWDFAHDADDLVALLFEGAQDRRRRS